MKRIKALAAVIKRKITVESWTLFLLVIGLPVIGLLYVDLRLAITVFVVVNATIGILYLRNTK